MPKPLTEFDLLSRIKRVPSGCWEWQRALRNGYGAVKMQQRNTYAHRVFYQMYCGELLAGMNVCHHCDNRKCVNPVHLFQGTPKQNTADMVAKGRDPHGSKHPGAKFTAEQVAAIRAMQGVRPMLQLAREYGVRDTTIRRIMHRERYVCI